jgi:eukaryotic-like serine/threonine-protein kinase
VKRVLAGLLCVAAALAAHAQSMFRGDATHRGVMDSAAPRSLKGVKWSFPTGDKVVSSPVWHAGVLYVGSDDGNVYAIDAASGRQRWAARTGGPVPSTPAVAGGRVFVVSYDGRLHALDAATGAPLWKFATEGERRFEARGLHGSQPRTQTVADPYDVYLSSPVVAQGLVVFGSGDGHVYALDAASGALRWKFRTGDVVHASPAVEGGTVFIGSWDGRFYALDLATGAERWRFQAGLDPLMHNQQGFQASAAVVDGVVYVGCRDAHLYALDAKTGAERWRFSTGQSWVVGSPAVAGGRVIFATSDSSLVHIVDAASGKPLAEQRAPGYMFSSPTLAGDMILIGVLNGSLQARDLSSGAERWTFRTEASLANRGWVLTADGRQNTPWVFFASNWRESMAIGFERQSSVGSIFSTPLVVGGVVYIGSADGRVYALE